MVPGVPGLPGPSVPRLVAEELRAGTETVLDQPRLLVGETVMVKSLKRDSVIPSPVLVINNKTQYC